ncbi:cytochrome c oxidase assembly protein [Jatrophihabitans sp. YIM 134969]
MAHRGRGLLTAIWTVAGLVLAGLVVFVVRFAAGGSGHDAGHTLFAAGDGPAGTSLLGSQLLTAWQLDTTAVAFVVVLAAVYGAGILRWQRDHDTRWPVGRIVAFGIGLLAIVFATCGSIAVYDQTLFSAHMVGHLTLVMLAPSLLVAGAPLTLWRETRRDPARFDRIAKGAVVSVLTSPPVAFACYTVVIVGTHLTGLMDAIMDSTVLGQVEHLAYLVVGFQFFLLVIGDEPIRWRLSLLGRLGILGVGMAVDTFTGVVLLMATVPISMGVGVDALSDTKTGGAIMWVGGDGLMAVVMVLLVIGYLQRPQEGGREEKSWVEQARRGVFEEKTGAETGNQRAAVPGTQEDFDEDDRRREAYNRWLEKLSAGEPR